MVGPDARAVAIIGAARPAGIMGCVASHCCEDMRVHVELDCGIHDDSIDCPDCLVLYLGGTGEYGLPVRDGGSSFVVIGFCNRAEANSRPLTPVEGWSTREPCR